MAWRVEFNDTARDQLRRLDQQIARRIVTYMDRVAVLEDPRDRGDRLSGNLGGRWKYRVGDYRVICEIQDRILQVLVVRVGHRDQIYR